MKSCHPDTSRLEHSFFSMFPYLVQFSLFVSRHMLTMSHASVNFSLINIVAAIPYELGFEIISDLTAALSETSPIPARPFNRPQGGVEVSPLWEIKTDGLWLLLVLKLYSGFVGLGGRCTHLHN